MLKSKQKIHTMYEMKTKQIFYIPHDIYYYKSDLTLLLAEII